MADDDMERLDRAMEAIRRKAQVWETAELARMETTLSDTTPPAIYGDVPPPGCCHPYHEKHKRFIIDWLDGESNIGGYDLRLPVMERPSFMRFDAEAPATIPDMKILTVRRQKAFATAPYVGRPFIYWWWTGMDDHKRGVGGEKTTLAYVDDSFGEWRWSPYVTGVHRADVGGRGGGWSGRRGHRRAATGLAGLAGHLLPVPAVLVKYGLPGTTPGCCRRCGQDLSHQIHDIYEERNPRG